MAAKPAKSYERPGLSEEEIEEIREAFNLFDTDGSGAFQTSVLARAARRAPLAPSARPRARNAAWGARVRPRWLWLAWGRAGSRSRAARARTRGGAAAAQARSTRRS